MQKQSDIVFLCLQLGHRPKEISRNLILFVSKAQAIAARNDDAPLNTHMSHIIPFVKDRTWLRAAILLGMPCFENKL